MAVLLFALWNTNVPAPDATSAAVRNATFAGLGSVVVSATLLPAVARFRDSSAWLVASTGHGRGGRLVALPLAILPLALCCTVGAAISAAGLPWCLVVAMAAVLFVSAWETKDGGSRVVRAILLAGGLALAVGLAGAWLPYVATGAALAAAALFWRRTR
jgi:hypothetical protein